jgi:hypothetical protein
MLSVQVLRIDAFGSFENCGSQLAEYNRKLLQSSSKFVLATLLKGP